MQRAGGLLLRNQVIMLGVLFAASIWTLQGVTERLGGRDCDIKTTMSVKMMAVAFNDAVK